MVAPKDYSSQLDAITRIEGGLKEFPRILRDELRNHLSRGGGEDFCCNRWKDGHTLTLSNGRVAKFLLYSAGTKQALQASRFTYTKGRQIVVVKYPPTSTAPASSLIVVPKLPAAVMDDVPEKGWHSYTWRIWAPVGLRSSDHARPSSVSIVRAYENHIQASIMPEQLNPVGAKAHEGHEPAREAQSTIRRMTPDAPVLHNRDQESEHTEDSEDLELMGKIDQKPKFGSDQSSVLSEPQQPILKELINVQRQDVSSEHNVFKRGVESIVGEQDVGTGPNKKQLKLSMATINAKTIVPENPPAAMSSQLLPSMSDRQPARTQTVCHDVRTASPLIASVSAPTANTPAPDGAVLSSVENIDLLDPQQITLIFMDVDQTIRGESNMDECDTAYNLFDSAYEAGIIESDTRMLHIAIHAGKNDIRMKANNQASFEKKLLEPLKQMQLASANDPPTVYVRKGY